MALDQHNRILKLYLSLPTKKRFRRFKKTAEAARLLGVRPRTVRYWIDAGRVEAVRVGGLWFVDLNSVRWLSHDDSWN